MLADGYNIMRVLMTNILDRLQEEAPEVLDKIIEAKKAAKGGGSKVQMATARWR